MDLDFLYKILIILIPIVFISKYIIQFRKGEYTPMLFEIEDESCIDYLKRFIMMLLFITSTQFISDELFVTIAVLSIFLVITLVINILNYKSISNQFDKKIFLDTTILNFTIIAIIFLGIFLGKW